MTMPAANPSTSYGFKMLKAPTPEQIPESSLAFLQQIGEPGIIFVPGHTREKRVVTTLLHGNEPSGVEAIHKLLRSGFKPYADTIFIIVSVAAALREPVFTHRALPGSRDINRCFRPPYNDAPGRLAKQITDYLVDLAPQAIIDIHNTSGSGPSFSVATRLDDTHQALASHFTRWFIHTDIELGSIMEVPFCCPIVTIEAGGALDELSAANAYDGLQSYLTAEDVFVARQDMALLKQPKRLEIYNEVSLAYAERPVFGANVTIRQDIEQHNFGITRPGDVLGWLDHNKLDHFRLAGHQANQFIDDYFSVYNNELTVTRPLKMFMVTTRGDIAKSDCLLYFVDTDSS
ncbi:MAG: succinylglutamate desuccinylase/aspartoacylase family protein [Alteromonadaceae bacterium]|nr:succinylglutamate desuccinylase/aspartoacylase family protein [Alteromonadaceae bacterium]